MTSDTTAPAFGTLDLGDLDLADLPVLTIKPPWPYAIFHLGKSPENRTWEPLGRWRGYRGPLLVHAGASIDRAARNPRTGDRFPEAAYQVRRALLGVVLLTGSHPPGAPPGNPWHGCNTDGSLCSPWAQDDSYHWTLASPVLFRRPVFCSGMLGLWTADRLPLVPRANLRAELASLPPIATAPASPVAVSTPADVARALGTSASAATSPHTPRVVGRG